MGKIKNFKIRDIKITRIFRIDLGKYGKEQCFHYDFSFGKDRKRFHVKARDLKDFKRKLESCYSNVERAIKGEDLELIDVKGEFRVENEEEKEWDCKTIVLIGEINSGMSSLAKFKKYEKNVKGEMEK